MVTPLRALCCLLFLGLFTSSSLYGQRLKRLADKAYEMADYDQAVELYDRLLRKREGDPATALRYGRALRLVGRLDEAAATLAAIELSDDPELPFQRALVSMELGRYPQAVESVFAAAQAKHPGADALAERLEYAQAHVNDQSGWTVFNEFANSPDDDFAPSVTGGHVVFASRRKNGGLQLFRSARDGSKFLGEPKALHRLGPLPGGEAPVAYSPSGQLVAVTRNNFVPNERLIPAAGWELSLALALASIEADFLPGKTFVHNASGANTGFPSFSQDGRRLYFASDRPGGMGGYDIYFCERKQDNWGVPINAGPAVNSPGNEISPNAESGPLYFASDYLPGFGGMDLYRADLVDGTFSAVTNLGPGINSPLDDIGFAVDEGGSLAYFASNRRGGKGAMDLYRAERTGQAVTLAVVDGKSGAPIANAILDFSDCQQGIFLTGADGAYTFRALPTLQCRPVVRKSGYNAKQFSVDGKRLSSQRRMEILLNPEDKITIYEGKVVHSRTGDVVSGAQITARHTGRNFTSDAVTDDRGHYKLSLEREGEYVVTYEAQGMAQIDREVTTYDRDGANILSTFAMFPAPGAAPTQSSIEMTTGETSATATIATPYDYGTAPINRGASTSGLRADNRQLAGAATPSTEGVPSEATTLTRSRGRRATLGSNVVSGFAVQVAALQLNSPEFEDYGRALSKVGTVYGKRENGMLKVRLGPYADRETATVTVKQIRKSGYPDAWVAGESGGEVIRPRALLVQLPPIDTGDVEDSSQIDTLAVDSYAVRLATYRSIANFDEAAAAKIGTVVLRRSGEYVITLLSGYSSVAEAETARGDAIAIGFPEAQVVRVGSNGGLRVVR